MEDYELQTLWKSVDTNIHQKSKTELELLLRSKSKDVVNKFLAFTIRSIVASIICLLYLGCSAVARLDDTIFVLNNAFLWVLCMLALIARFRYWQLLSDDYHYQPLKDWLEFRIKILSYWPSSTYRSYYVIPFLNASLGLSLIVFIHNMPFIEVLKSKPIMISFIPSYLFGLVICYVLLQRIARKFNRNLMFLKDLHRRITSVP